MDTITDLEGDMVMLFTLFLRSKETIGATLADMVKVHPVDWRGVWKLKVDEEEAHRKYEYAIVAMILENKETMRDMILRETTLSNDDYY